MGRFVTYGGTGATAMGPFYRVGGVASAATSLCFCKSVISS